MALKRVLELPAAAAPLFVVLALSTAQAGGQAAWFDSLRMPGTKASCCDVADCHRTEADWLKGSWWALVDQKWRQVPSNSVLSDPVSPDGSAYVCVGASAWSIGEDDPPIYCFVPPNWPS
jgi:hypothetical protein